MKSTLQNTSQTNLPSILGWAGLVPFGLATLGTHSGLEALVRYGFLGGTAYGAVILSFLGAVHWGLAMGAMVGSYEFFPGMPPYWHLMH